jgi:hypothetical protein
MVRFARIALNSVGKQKSIKKPIWGRKIGKKANLLL